MAAKPATPARRTRKVSPPPSAWEKLIQSSWTKVLSVILTLGAVAGVFWAADQHWVNFPFHTQSSELTLSKSTDYAKQLDADNNKKLTELAVSIEKIQINAEIKSAQDQVIFLLRQEMSMKEAMAKMSVANKPISMDFKAKLAEVVSEREAAQVELKKLMQAKK